MVPSFAQTQPAVSPEAAREFLKKRARSEFIGNIGIAALSLFGAALVFLLVCWVSFFFSYTSRVGHLWLWMALGVTAFSFIAYATQDPEYLSKLEVGTVDGREAYYITLPGGWSVTNLNPLDPKTHKTLAKIILQILTTIPRGLATAWRYARRSAGLLRVDIESIAPMFQSLVERGRRIPYHELAGFSLRDPGKCFSDLLLLDVVQHLKSQPQGMVINSSIRERITGISSSSCDF